MTNEIHMERMMITSGWEDQEMGSCLMGTEFQFYKMKKFWRSASQHANTLNTNYTIHLKMVKRVNFMFFFLYHNKNKTKQNKNQHNIFERAWV